MKIKQLFCWHKWIEPIEKDPECEYNLLMLEKCDKCGKTRNFRGKYELVITASEGIESNPFNYMKVGDQEYKFMKIRKDGSILYEPVKQKEK